MFLKKIEMQGFKSFADKTKVEFDQGVTAVVGPNGSGKSNITESLRWALGESSAKSLRGGKMPDVIFAGTQNRKPLNYAQVTVTLDNSDNFISDRPEEIRVERHIYRNGDCEYLIDGKKVRLRDIHDLFMDTGLGRDSFSIISQGRVEAIFNSKPEERRAIFEEAAGVLKYKTRKKETETKLNQTQDNLDRLEDIIYELDNQLKPLEKQAETAKRFRILEDERKSLQLDILVDDIISFREKWQSKEDSLAQTKEELSAYYQQRERLETKNQNLKEKRHELNNQLATYQAELMDLTRLKSDLERQIDLLALESSQNEEKKADAGKRLNQMKTDKETLEQSKAEKETLLADISDHLAATKLNISSLETQLETFSTNPDQIIETLREEFVSLMEKEVDLSNALTSVQAEIDSRIQALESKSSELAQLLSEKADLEKDEELKKAEHQEAIDHVQDLLNDYQVSAKDLETCQTDYQNQQQKMFDLLDQVKNKEARQQSLLAIQKNHSNFFAGVKAVLQSADNIGGIIGAVSEHLNFEATYQTALEIALGGASQHIIVEDESAAKRSIDFLKKNRSGRATFLPLTTIKSREVAGNNRQKLEAADGFLGFANDLVTFEPKLTAIFDNLLGTTAIFETIDQANRAARLVNFQVRMVTLDGSEIRPGGSFAGGSNRQNSTTFIKPELDTLTQELALLKNSLRQQEESVEKARQTLQETEAKLTQIKESGEKARLSEQTAQFAYKQVAERLEQVTNLCSVLQSQSDQAATQELEEKKSALSAQLLTIESQKKQVSENLTEIKRDKDSITAKVTELNQQLSHYRLEERERMSEERFERANLNRILAEIASLNKEIVTLENWLTSAPSEVDVDQLPILTGRLEETAKRHTETEQALVRLKFEVEDCEGSLDDIEEQLQKASHKNEGLIRQQAQLEAEISNLGEKLQSFARQLTEDYQMSFEEAKEQARQLENLALSRQSLSELNRQIKALGPINLDAIAQYDEVSERLIFLNTQRDDLVHAKNLLLDTINDMDDEVKLRFKSTFEAIRESFKQTFTQMFGGGSADLILTEGDLLTSGVEISVQPPGKKIQSLNLMSGGEKALSALALLFAIIRIKTIPFVILDEVEAALDEANVKRFGDYLNRFDKDSQFIVVTHRKGTMAAADSIYGVTMQESGVSKIVSVKLKDAEKMVN
ncbi:chromosome segregation protein SMC [Streptococcus hillyeri]|uniref:Chromosome partition protein Smc n=1 Tax=Streptococcus hillyeri TaxID=2282420 RepID=A0A3L9DV97_9STRE|nr:chromosome segregation protein SMC [Streptococcus hillyeri]RLY05406.1 chromosome segregation protein SMC [Streptococcus hillyeri]